MRLLSRLSERQRRVLVAFSLVATVILALSACVDGPPPDVTPPLTPSITVTPAAISGLPASQTTTATPLPPEETPTAVEETAPAYPPPAATGTPAPYPEPSVTFTPGPSLTPRPLTTVNPFTFLPLFFGVATITPTPTVTPSPTPSPTPTIDFAAVRTQLQASGQDLGFSKIGFHTGPGGNATGIGDWMRRLDAAGVPFFIKTADDFGPLYEAQEIVRNSDVPHTLVFRLSGDSYDTPDYSLPPAQAAEAHWLLHKASLPPELDPSITWIETINEVDKERARWLAQFAVRTAELALADGYRWAAFGWSAGEPEILDWETPEMLAFLRLAAGRPDRIAVALHEYSFLADDIGHDYPYKVGRFQLLYEVCDRYNIPRPTVLITEWGWGYNDVPDPGKALEDIRWAAALYAPYPELKGAAIWYLGTGYNDIATETQRLIAPVLNYSLGNYFAIPLPPARQPIQPDAFRP